MWQLEELCPVIYCILCFVPVIVADGYSATGLINDQRVWSIKECAEVFAKSVALLKNQLSVEAGEDGVLIWDKVGFDIDFIGVFTLTFHSV